MALQLYAHPFSSYCQKVLIALYEQGIPFEMKQLGGDADIQAEFAALWPLRKMPLLRDGDRSVMEASVIIEYLDLRQSAERRLLPADAEAALNIRLLDRFFDCYVMTPMQKIVGDHLRPADQRDPRGVADALAQLDSAYAWLDQTLSDGRTWAGGQAFSLADCAAAPSLFYADWVQPIPQALSHARAYRQRLLARPSMARAVDEARPFRSYFPPGAPDRD